VLGLSQKAYIEKMLKRYGMDKCATTSVPFAKGDKFGLHQYPKNQLELDQMKNIPYASAVRSIIYAQVCTRQDLAFVAGMLGRYQSNPREVHWKGAKKALRYCQCTKEIMLRYKRSEKLEIVGYSDADFAGCVDSRKSTSGLRVVLILENPHQVIYSHSRGELFHGKAPNKPWLHHQLCKLSMWHVMKH
jgi:hypothetical protein